MDQVGSRDGRRGGLIARIQRRRQAHPPEVTHRGPTLLSCRARVPPAAAVLLVASTLIWRRTAADLRSRGARRRALLR